jgi:deoxyribodipyrimidine photo-lyase
MSHDPVIVWFREDLRISDNPALVQACQTKRPLIALYILDEESRGLRAPGGAHRWWLHYAVEVLAGDLKSLTIPLILRKGKAENVLDDVIKDSGAGALYWNRRYEHHAIKVDKAIKEQVKGQGLEVKSFNGRLLIEPWEVQTKSGDFYKVFTPFAKSVRQQLHLEQPLSAPDKATGFESALDSDHLKDWELLPTKPNWAKAFPKVWTPGQKGAEQRLEDFLDNGLDDYKAIRDIPSKDGTSRLSPHLHFGEISPRQIWHKVQALIDDGKVSDQSAFTFQQELLWREFSYHLLYHFGPLADENFNNKFNAFPWAETNQNQDKLHAWKTGQTGYPLVDAGMRQLWAIGWMHNRVRMVVGSFLVKHLLLDWRLGEQWFWDTLVDGDPGSNTASWQWVAGTGADAAPYFRIFNPTLQSEKFDKKGDYIRHWVPELKDLPDQYIHEPSKAPDDVLQKAAITLGKTYPKPIVEHKKARERALQAYEQVKSS